MLGSKSLAGRSEELDRQCGANELDWVPESDGDLYDGFLWVWVGRGLCVGSGTGVGVRRCGLFPAASHVPLVASAISARTIGMAVALLDLLALGAHAALILSRSECFRGVSEYAGSGYLYERRRSASWLSVPATVDRL